eukprot:SAG31_NODE_1604_length_7767_cov_4.103808_4_plen_1551_part_00
MPGALTTSSGSAQLEDRRSGGLLAVAQKRYKEAIEALTQGTHDHSDSDSDSQKHAADAATPWFLPCTAASCCRAVFVTLLLMSAFAPRAVVTDGDTELLLALAFAYLQTNDLNRCFLTCQKAIENAAANGVDIKTARYSKDVLYGVGCEYYKLGECDVANFAFEQVLGLLAERSASPLQFDVTWRLGILAREMEELDEAVQYLTAVVESPPPPMESADVWVEIGCIRQEQREEELAREAFARALDSGADVTRSEYWHDLTLKLEQVVVVPEHTRGTAAARTGARRAEAAIRRAIELSPERAEAWLLLGCILYRADRNREAREVLRHAIELDPTLLEAWIKLGEACEGLQLWPEAVDVYRSALRNLMPAGPRADDLWEHLDWLMTRLDYDFHVSFNKKNDRPPSARPKHASALQPNLNGNAQRFLGPDRNLMVDMTRPQMDALGRAINEAQAQDALVLENGLMKTLDRLKSKLVDDAAVADTSMRRPGSASRRKNLIPLKPRPYDDGTKYMGAMPMKRPKGRKVPISPEENEALNRAIDAAQSGLILKRKPSQLDVQLDLVKAGLVAAQEKTPSTVVDIRLPRPLTARSRELQPKRKVDHGNWEPSDHLEPRERIVPRVSDLEGVAERKRLQREKKVLEDKLRLAADPSRHLAYRTPDWNAPPPPPKPKPAHPKMSRLALGDLARGDPGSTACTLTLSPAATKVLIQTVQNAYADLCQHPQQNDARLTHLDNFSVQLLQQQGRSVAEALPARPRSANSRGFDGRNSAAPKLVLHRKPPSPYKNTVVRVSEAALPTLERAVATAQSDFAGDARALDIIDWIRAELFAGRGAAFQAEEAGAPLTERGHRRPKGRPRTAGRRNQLPSHVDGPIEMRQRRRIRRTRRRQEYNATGGAAEKSGGEIVTVLESGKEQDGVLLAAIGEMREKLREQELLIDKLQQGQLDREAAKLAAEAARLPGSPKKTQVEAELLERREYALLESQLAALKEQLTLVTAEKDAQAAELAKPRDRLRFAEPGVHGPGQAPGRPTATQAPRPKVSGPSAAPPPFMFEELQRKVQECKSFLLTANELRDELSSTKLTLFRTKDAASAARRGAEDRISKMEAEILKLKGQLLEERQASAEARRALEHAEQRAAAAEEAAEQSKPNPLERKQLVIAPAPEGKIEDEYDRRKREADAVAMAVAEVDRDGRIRAMGVALTEARKDAAEREVMHAALRKERDGLLGVLAKHEMNFDKLATTQKELESRLSAAEARETDLLRRATEAEAATAEMESELRDAQHIVAPLRSKVDAMQQQIAKLKGRERTLSEANEVLQQSALRKEADRLEHVQVRLLEVLANRVEPSQHEFEEPTLEEVQEYAEYLGIDPVVDQQYLWIAREAMVAPVPAGWEMATGEDGYPYFFKTGSVTSATNEHPSDEEFRELYRCLKWGLDPRKPLERMDPAEATATVYEEIERRRRLEGTSEAHSGGRSVGRAGRGGRGRGRGGRGGRGGLRGSNLSQLSLTDRMGGPTELAGTPLAGRPITPSSGVLPVSALTPDQRRMLALEMGADTTNP